MPKKSASHLKTKVSQTTFYYIADSLSKFNASLDSYSVKPRSPWEKLCFRDSGCTGKMIPVHILSPLRGIRTLHHILKSV